MEKVNNQKKVNAYLKNLFITPRKVRLVTDSLANKSITEVIGILENTPKRASPMILKLLNSAIANATNNEKMNFNNLIIDAIIVNEGKKLKRFRPRARGVTYPIIKRYSHINIILREEKKSEIITNQVETKGENR